MTKLRILFLGLVSALIFSTILFLSAGKVSYLQGWIFLSTNVVTTLIHFFAFPQNPELLDERSKVKEGAKSWDKMLLRISGLVYVITIIVAGLDSGRFHWSPDFGWPVYIAGIALTIIGQAIFLAALRENKFFSSVVRIQKERGHAVCDTGVYRIVRHPGYLGMVISLTGIPFITCSIWSLAPTAIAIVLLFIRTSLEDATLKNELAGYVDYMHKTRRKLIPFIW